MCILRWYNCLHEHMQGTSAWVDTLGFNGVHTWFMNLTLCFVCVTYLTLTANTFVKRKKKEIKYQLESNVT